MTERVDVEGLCEEIATLKCRAEAAEDAVASWVSSERAEFRAEVAALRALVVDVAYILSSGRGLASDMRWEDRAMAAHAKLAPVADQIEGRAALAAQEPR